jgi:hypothetical protein
MARITYARVHELLRYDPESGLLFWRVDRPPVSAGDVAGCRDVYVLVCVERKLYGAHRIIWFMVTGRWPHQIDHCDGDGLNNRWANLRSCTTSENQQNQRAVRKNNPSGVTGAFWDKRDKRWFSHIYVNRKQIYLGTFESAEAAHAAYIAAKKTHHTFCGEQRGRRIEPVR